MTHVAEIIEDEMRERGWSAADITARMGGTTEDERRIDGLALDLTLAVRTVDALFTEKMAEKLGGAIGVDPQFLLNVDESWRRGCLVSLLEQYRVKLREVARKADCTVFAGRVDAHFALNSERSAAGIVFRLKEGK